MWILTLELGNACLLQGSNVYWGSALFTQKALHCASEEHAYVRSLEVWSCTSLNPPAILQKQDCQSGLLGRRHHYIPPWRCTPACRSADGLATQRSFPSLPCTAAFSGGRPAASPSPHSGGVRPTDAPGASTGGCFLLFFLIDSGGERRELL